MFAAQYTKSRFLGFGLVSCDTNPGTSRNTPWDLQSRGTEAAATRLLPAGLGAVSSVSDPFVDRGPMSSASTHETVPG